jgi:hypothetical protein
MLWADPGGLIAADYESVELITARKDYLYTSWNVYRSVFTLMGAIYIRNCPVLTVIPKYKDLC